MHHKPGFSKSRKADISHQSLINRTIRCGEFLVFTALCGCTTFAPPNAPAVADRVFVYRCDSGKMIRAEYRPDQTADVTYDGRIHRMTVAISGSGARYAGDGLEWWTVGTGAGAAAGTLFRHRADGATGETVEQCKQAAPAQNPQ